MDYDYLVLAAGANVNTFNTPGVEFGKNNVYFMKDLEHARAIRNRVVRCFEEASLPTKSEEDKRRLLSFVIVGGGPVSVEFAGELYDMVRQDLVKLYPDLKEFTKIHLVEAGKHVLATFNPELQDYAENAMQKRDYDLRLGVAVKEVRDGEVELVDGTIIPCGLVMWSTGIMPTKFISSLAAQPNDFVLWNGRLLMDNTMRVLKPGRQQASEAFHEPYKNIFALGDCAACNMAPLPSLGYAAKKQGQYLAKNFNAMTMEQPKKKFSFIAWAQFT